MNWSFRIGKIFGVATYLHFSWILLVGVIVAVTIDIFPNDSALWLRIGAGLCVCGFWLLALAAHELAHRYASRKRNTPINSVTLFIFGAVPRVPYEGDSPRSDFKVAFIGLLSIAAISVVLTAIWVMANPAMEDPYVNPLFLLTASFVAVGMINLLPGYPMDGGRMFRAILWWITGDYRKSTRITSILGELIGLMLIVFGIVVMIKSDLTPATGLWFASIGWLIYNASSICRHQVRERSALRWMTASDAMAPPQREYASPSLMVGQLMRQNLIPRKDWFCPVVEAGKLLGIITLSSIKSIPQSVWDVTTVAQILSSPDAYLMAQPGDDGGSLMERMDAHNINQLLVVRDDLLLGTVTRDSLLEGARVRSQLGGVEHGTAPC